MKKLVFALIAMATVPAMADYYRTRTNNCDPAAMHAVLERAAREHRAVITEVNCEYARVEPVVVAQPAPTYVSTYAAPAVDYSNIPVVDCVPHPTRQEYCGGCR
jgi:hypothetical protein